MKPCNAASIVHRVSLHLPRVCCRSPASSWTASSSPSSSSSRRCCCIMSGRSTERRAPTGSSTCQTSWPNSRTTSRSWSVGQQSFHCQQARLVIGTELGPVSWSPCALLKLDFLTNAMHLLCALVGKSSWRKASWNRLLVFVTVWYSLESEMNTRIPSETA